MRHIHKYFLAVVFIHFTLIMEAATTEWGSAGSDYTLSSNYTIASGDTVIVLGNFFDANNKKIIISSGATFIVHGNMALKNTNSDISGNVIVLGDVDLKNTDMGVSGNLVVGGVLTNSSGNVNGIVGDVYLLDPDANEGVDIDLPNEPLDIEDLLNDSNDNELIDIISDNVDNTGVSYNWDGSESSDWATSGNWSGNEVPGSLDEVIIDNVASLPQCPSVLTIQDLTVKTGASFTISQGSQISILGNITVESGAELIVQNSNTTPTSFIVYGDVTGDIKFEWTYNNTRWWFIGHPISDANISDYDDILTTNGGTNDYVLYDYQDPDVFAKISQTAYDFTAQSPIKGYLFKVKDDNTPLTMSGAINNDAEYTKTLQTDWQVIANPYPSYYQVPTESGAGTDFDNTTGDIYVTVSTSNSDKVYHTFNSLLGIGSPAEFTGVIAPGQGFYVQTYSAGDIKMRAANRMHSVTTQLKSAKKSSESDVLRLKLKNENGSTDEAVIAFFDSGQSGFTKLDSEQRFNSNGVSYIYSVVESKKAVINVLPPVDEDIIQAIGIKAQTGNHQLYIDGIESLNGDCEITLEDKLTGVLTNMQTGTIYEFSTEEGDFDERFVLHLKKVQVATSVSEEKVDEGVAIYIEGSNELTIKCDWQTDKKNVSIYSISGEEVSKDEFVGNIYNKSLRLTTGVYIIQVTADQSRYQQKVFIR